MDMQKLVFYQKDMKIYLKVNYGHHFKKQKKKEKKKDTPEDVSNKVQKAEKIQLVNALKDFSDGNINI